MAGKLRAHFRNNKEAVKLALSRASAVLWPRVRLIEFWDESCQPGALKLCPVVDAVQDDSNGMKGWPVWLRAHMYGFQLKQETDPVPGGGPVRKKKKKNERKKDKVQHFLVNPEDHGRIAAAVFVSTGPLTFRVIPDLYSAESIIRACSLAAGAVWSELPVLDRQQSVSPSDNIICSKFEELGFYVVGAALHFFVAYPQPNDRRCEMPPQSTLLYRLLNQMRRHRPRAFGVSMVYRPETQKTTYPFGANDELSEDFTSSMMDELCQGNAFYCYCGRDSNGPIDFVFIVPVGPKSTPPSVGHGKHSANKTPARGPKQVVEALGTASPQLL